jgi:Asp/Glu/hydantoin racemase
MKKLVLIHTVSWYNKSVIIPFAEPWLKQNPDVEIFNIMDDSLLSESLAYGGPTRAVFRRMVNYYQAAESMGADVIMCTCTTMGPCTRLAREIIKKPVMNIDEPMAKEAVGKGKVMGVFATFPTSAPATRKLLELEASLQQREISIKTVINEDAARHLLRNEMDRHDEIVHGELEKLQNEVDVIVLGQVSLSGIKFNGRVPVLQVGRSGFDHARKLLDSAN